VASTAIEHSCYEQCGDGYDFGTFGCEDGDNTADDGCNADCEVEEGFYCNGGTSSVADTCFEVCGDQFNLGLLPCDDGNDVSGDGCYEFKSIFLCII
jgi:cysteine-rich repeat protein